MSEVSLKQLEEAIKKSAERWRKTAETVQNVGAMRLISAFEDDVLREFVAFKKAEVLKIAKIKRMKEGEHGFDFTPSYLTLHKTVDAVLQILDKPPMEACVIVPRKQLEAEITKLDEILTSDIMIMVCKHNPKFRDRWEGQKQVFKELLGK